MDAVYEAGRVTLHLLGAESLQPFSWGPTESQPYYLIKDSGRGTSNEVRKRDLFTGDEVTLNRVNVTGKVPKSLEAWETEIDPALSYVYDNALRFGVLHRMENDRWTPQS